MNKLALISLSVLGFASCTKERPKPNVVIIFTDDHGYQDLSCYNSPNIKTPELDKLASEGIRLTDFYVSASVSSASRAGLLTGRLNCHNGVGGVFFPEKPGMNPDEITIAEAMREQGYATACIGKWHLGEADQYMPLNQGFDSYYGLPYSNDMYISPILKFAKDVEFTGGYTMEMAKEDMAVSGSKIPNGDKKTLLKMACPLMRGNEIVEYPCIQETLTQRYFDEAIKFIDECKDKPFFTFITPSMPHYPVFASDDFKGKSKQGIYGDAVQEIDWNVGRLMNFLDEKGLAENTLVIFSTDNGPWLGLGEESGSAGLFRDGKFSNYEGGVRTPCIIRWKGQVPEGIVSNNIFASIDLFPTIMNLIGVNEFEQHIDGIDQTEFLLDPSKNLRDEYIHVKGGKPIGLRKGDWVYLPTSGERFVDKQNITPQLFNLKDDISQQTNLFEANPEKVAEMKALFEQRVSEIESVK